jgi:hypothetical protein
MVQVLRKKNTAEFLLVESKTCIYLKDRSVGKETGRTISLAEATTRWFVKLISHKSNSSRL